MSRRDEVNGEDRRIANAVIDRFMGKPLEGHVYTEASADMGTWRRRFALCARNARIAERRRIGRSLCTNPGDDDE